MAPDGQAAPPPLTTIAKRRDFLAAARARRQSSPSLTLQARRRGEDEAATGIRVGYTCSKKIGNAVVRNRAKRRLRAAARLVVPGLGYPGWDYVLIGRPGETVTRPFTALCDELTTALRTLHGREGAR